MLKTAQVERCYIGTDNGSSIMVSYQITISRLYCHQYSALALSLPGQASSLAMRHALHQRVPYILDVRYHANCR